MDSYKKSGVDIHKADEVVSFLKPLAEKTYHKEVSSHLGGYGALYELDTQKYSHPIIVTSTDGVGTKLKIAFMAGKHNTIGIDLVAMCVNDILCCGAEPKLFLDYYATGSLDTQISQEILKGIVKGCELAECSLVGGEIAEMPGLYQEKEYDLAGFTVGIANKKDIFNPNDLQEGDTLIALASNGLHSNGYSLVRKILLDDLKMDIKDIQDELLKPTKIYVSLFKKLRENFTLKGAAHITGGGIPGNLPRIFPKHLVPQVDYSSWEKPAIFKTLQEKGNLTDEEMVKTFNCGVGMILAVSKEETENLLRFLRDEKEEAWIIGGVVST